MPWFKPLLNVSWKSLCRRIYKICGETDSILFFKALRPTFMLFSKKSTSAFVYGATFSFGRQLCADVITIPIEKKKDGRPLVGLCSQCYQLEIKWVARCWNHYIYEFSEENQRKTSLLMWKRKKHCPLVHISFVEATIGKKAIHKRFFYWRHKSKRLNEMIK
jgi:hypothetical protein